jgi:hypothetical protein
MKNMMNKRLSGCALLLACVINIDLGEGLSNASQQVTETAPVAQGQMQARQNPNNDDRIGPDSGGVREIDGTQRSSSSTGEAVPFGGDTCRPEKIEATPCQ